MVFYAVRRDRRVRPAGNPDGQPGMPARCRPAADRAALDDPGMGDLLRFDAERLRILVERHLLHTGSPRAKQILDNWDASLAKFVKVMPVDYKRALAEQQKEALAK